MAKILMSLALVLLLISSVATTVAQGNDATVTAVHGIPGVAVDVYVGEQLVLEDFAPGTVSESMAVPAGVHAVSIRTAGAAADSEPLVSETISVLSDENLSIVAHLDEDGEPAISVFANNVAPIAYGQSRIVVRHVADAPELDVLADGLRLFDHIAPLEEVQADLGPVSFDLSITVADTQDPIVGPFGFTMEAGTAHIVYAFGSLDDGTMGTVIQTIEGLEAPEPVPSGTVSIIQGIPGQTVDVYIDGALALEDVEAGTVNQPFELGVGDHSVAIRAANAGAGAAVIASGEFELGQGADISVVAHLDDSGAPTVSAYLNALPVPQAGQSRLTFRHTADAGPLTVIVDGAPIYEDLMPGNEISTEIQAGTHTFAFSLADADEPLAGPVEINIKAGSHYFIYAVGSAEGDSVDILAQAIPYEPVTPGEPGTPPPPPPPPPLPSGPSPADPAEPKDGCVFFEATEHNACAGFLEYWEEFGGLALFGFPITEEFVDEDGTTVQYYERARFEWHPGEWPERWDVLLGLLGNEIAADRMDEEPFERTVDNGTAECTFYAQTGHNLCAGFQAYWEDFGGLAIYGFPISEEFRELNQDTGEVYTVQYFERARFEWHPGEWPEYYDVMLGRIGVEVFADRYGAD